MPFCGVSGKEQRFGSCLEAHVCLARVFLFLYFLKWKSGIFYSLRKSRMRILRINLEEYCGTCCIRAYSPDLDIDVCVLWYTEYSAVLKQNPMLS